MATDRFIGQNFKAFLPPNPTQSSSQKWLESYESDFNIRHKKRKEKKEKRKMI